MGDSAVGTRVVLLCVCVVSFWHPTLHIFGRMLLWQSSHLLFLAAFLEEGCAVLLSLKRTEPEPRPIV